MPIIQPKDLSPQTATVTPQSAAERLSQLSQPAEVEAPVEASPEVEEPKPEAKDAFLSPRFAALARQQKEIRRQQAELKAREEKMKTDMARYESDYIPKSKLLENPLDVLAQSGVSYDKLVEMAVQYPTMNDPVIKQIKDELNSIKEEKSKAQEEQKRRDAEQYEKAVNTIRNEAKLLIDSDPAFETVKEEGQQEAVVALIEETFKEEGKLLSIEEAAQEVENYLIEEAVRRAQLKKVKARLQPAVPVETPESPQVPKKTVPQQPIKTITHAATAAPSKPLSAQDRRARAIAAFRGEL